MKRNLKKLTVALITVSFGAIASWNAVAGTDGTSGTHLKEHGAIVVADASGTSGSPSSGTAPAGNSIDRSKPTATTSPRIAPRTGTESKPAGNNAATDDTSADVGSPRANNGTGPMGDGNPHTNLGQSRSGPVGSNAGVNTDPGTWRSVQAALNGKGYSVGTVDGQAGPNTTDALRRFQQAQGLPATGELDARTMTALGISQPYSPTLPRSSM